MKRTGHARLAAVIVLCLGMTACGSRSGSTETSVTSASVQAASDAVREASGETAKETPAPSAIPEAGSSGTEKAPSEEDADIREIGSADGEEVRTVRIKNRSGHAIKGIEIKVASGAYDADLLSGEGAIADGETCIIHYDAANGLDLFEAGQADAEADSPVMTPEYRIRVTYDDGAGHELHAFPFGDADEVSLMRDGDISYIVYRSVMTGSEVITAEAERAAAEVVSAYAAAERVQPAGTEDDPAEGNDSAKGDDPGADVQTWEYSYDAAGGDIVGEENAVSGEGAYSEPSQEIAGQAVQEYSEQPVLESPDESGQDSGA